MTDSEQKIKLKIQRYDGYGRPYWKSIEIPAGRGMTVLDGLQHVKENLDSTLAWRSSCRMGICGSCGVMINGKPKLACQTQILELKQPVILKPLANMPVIRDLVSDLSGTFEQHRNVKPWIIRRDQQELDKPTREFLQSAHEMVDYFQFSYCIKCGLCMSVCPTLATDRRYLGPQPLAQAYRYLQDSRDDGAAERSNVFDGIGAWRCHFAGECSQVCPKHVDPALAIQGLKRMTFMRSSPRDHKDAALVAAKITKLNPRKDIPDAPPRTVRST